MQYEQEKNQMIEPNEDEENIQIGDTVDSISGMNKQGKVLESKIENGTQLIKVEWPNGLIQERSIRTVYKSR
jgi:hypothetical protein